MIKPAIGRKVWFMPSDEDKAGSFGMTQHCGDPLDATIIAVITARHVNLQVHDHEGEGFIVKDALLIQEGETLPDPTEDGHGYAYWMPYQVSQAAAPVRTLELQPLDMPGGTVMDLRDGCGDVHFTGHLTMTTPATEAGRQAGLVRD